MSAAFQAPGCATTWLSMCTFSFPPRFASNDGTAEPGSCANAGAVSANAATPRMNRRIGILFWVKNGGKPVVNGPRTGVRGVCPEVCARAMRRALCLSLHPPISYEFLACSSWTPRGSLKRLCDDGCLDDKSRDRQHESH